MAHFIPYHRAKNYGAHRCRSVTIAFNPKRIDTEYEALAEVEEYMEQSEGGWTAEWIRVNNELIIYSTDDEALTYVSMLSER